jgi:peptide/nickel transport system permease protein
MVSYVLKRLAIGLPTLWVVLIIAFGLSKCHHTDSAYELCKLEGITPGSMSESQSYAKHYMQLGLDKPPFYFSIKPHFHHPNPELVIDIDKRSQLKTLQKEGIDYKIVMAYLSTRDSLIQAKDSVAKTMIFLADYKTIVKQTQKLNVSHPLHIYTQLLKPIDYYYPIVRWNGFDNQVHKWTKSIFRGDFGVSIRDGADAKNRIGSALRWTILLLVFHILISSFISVFVGIICALNKDKWQDKLLQNLALVFYSIPTFWLASILILYFVGDRYGMGIFPIPGNWYIDNQYSFLGQVASQGQQLVLPMLCLVINDIAFFSRLVRSRIIEESGQLYAIMAKVRGIQPKVILRKYVLPNTFITLTSTIVGMIPAGLSGSLMIEVIFNIPGMGRLMYESIQIGDWSVVYGVIAIVAAVTITCMILGDIVYAAVNPKIRDQYAAA